ncbi:hypothetical protein PENANT_c009G00631 [Penicillium antarcticum]|uniref:Zn(2)-C6 fungal-type domain-containing protein n=1 Tax=Penicillium antarcticum TaxID=416450 RepID=A0A1V6Q974_9EURO|nr:uncharacterized protein N7508_006297 [Penicillium antarcticum]KAJ5301434.1 hypothetical protein N7508_006297 [Penicillium antarcticum]OQD85764.1 hypothetical protein PENANT_c009G00631 [Penicillium antarcticum]
MEPQRRYNVERSCLRCHERKLKCDKSTPCSRCVRQNTACQYPGPSRVKRQPPKKSMTDVAARLEQLERSIAAMVNERPCAPTDSSLDIKSDLTGGTGNSASSTTSTSTLPSIVKSDVQAKSKPPDQGFLSKDGRYINEPLLSRVLDKEKELQSAIGSPSEHSSPRRPPVLRAEGLIANPLLTQVDLKELYPSRWQATLLWQAFLSRVDPLVKVLHIPSTQSHIFAAINRPESVRSDVRALLFAIYFAATTAFISDDTQNESLHLDLRKYQQGMEISLYQAEFLDAPTITSLQAMVIYQTCFRYSNSGRSGWTLQGMTIRAAQSIGLQRDGKHFKLPQLECELRRRLWWQIQSADERVAEDHGLSVPENDHGDTEMPLNIDDGILTGLNDTPVESQAQWTAMTYALVIMEINKGRRMLLRTLDGSTDPTPAIEEFRKEIHEKYLRHADSDIPIQRFGLLLGQLLLAKAEVCIRQRIIHSQGPTSTSLDRGISQGSLDLACHAIELGLEIHTDELLRGFRWLTTTFTGYHPLTYVLWTLCVCPTGPHVDRSWRVVNMLFEITEDPQLPDPGAKWPMIVQLREKALRVRQAHEALQSSQRVAEDTAVYENGVNGTMCLDGGFDMNDWDPSFIENSDWNYLAHNLALLNGEA